MKKINWLAATVLGTFFMMCTGTFSHAMLSSTNEIRLIDVSSTGGRQLVQNLTITNNEGRDIQLNGIVALGANNKEIKGDIQVTATVVIPPGGVTVRNGESIGVTVTLISPKEELFIHNAKLYCNILVGLRNLTPDVANIRVFRGKEPITFNPGKIDFGTLKAGVSAVQQPVQIINNTPFDVQIRIDVSKTYGFSIGGEDSIILAGKSDGANPSVSLNAMFKPTSQNTGSFMGNIEVAVQDIIAPILAKIPMQVNIVSPNTDPTDPSHPTDPSMDSQSDSLPRVTGGSAGCSISTSESFSGTMLLGVFGSLFLALMMGSGFARKLS